MTKVIQNREGLYLKQGGAWTTHFEEAKKFPDIRAAVAICEHFHLSHIDLVLVVSDEPSKEYDVVLPLSG